jgi:hypothetical protein
MPTASRGSKAAQTNQREFLQACRGNVSHSTVTPGIKPYIGGRSRFNRAGARDELRLVGSRTHDFRG